MGKKTPDRETIAAGYASSLSVVDSESECAVVGHHGRNALAFHAYASFEPITQILTPRQNGHSILILEEHQNLVRAQRARGRGIAPMAIPQEGPYIVHWHVARPAAGGSMLHCE